MIFRSTALRFAALNGKIRFCEEGRITPLPSSLIPGLTDAKSSFVEKAEVKPVPPEFLT